MRGITLGHLVHGESTRKPEKCRCIRCGWTADRMRKMVVVERYQFGWCVKCGALMQRVLSRAEKRRQQAQQQLGEG